MLDISYKGLSDNNNMQHSIPLGSVSRLTSKNDYLKKTMLFSITTHCLHFASSNDGNICKMSHYLLKRANAEQLFK